MKHPWKEIKLDDYERHMKLDSVLQLQALNEMMKQQFNSYPISSVMILGVAGGNGLEHVDPTVIHRIYGIDINPTYLQACVTRHQSISNILTCLCLDLETQSKKLPHADMVIANLLLEYIGYACFITCIQTIKPTYVSCIIQVNVDPEFVSESPYKAVFEDLSTIHHQIKEDELINQMKVECYEVVERIERMLPNGKCFIQLDFIRH